MSLPASPQPCNAIRASASPAADTQIVALLSAAGIQRHGFWQQVIDTMNEGLLLVDPDRRIVFLNKKAEELIGRTLDEVRGALCIEAMNCPQCQCCCRLFQDGGAERVEISIFDLKNQRARVLLKNGRLLRDENGTLLGGVETFTDISLEVRQRQENERYTAMLFEQKTRIDALLGAMEDGVFSIDGDFKVRAFAPRMSQLLGIDEAAALGQHIGDLLDVTEGCLRCGAASELDGRTFRIKLRTPEAMDAAADLSFRRVRLGDDEMLGILRIQDKAKAPPNAVDGPPMFHGIVSRSPQMHAIFRLLEGAAQTSANILIEGESGVGKELVARAIHRLSPRASEPFYAVNCATFAGSLLLSELFGHERGAFTGAFRTTKGKLELAGAGTLFLDEISEIPLHYQAVLLRVLEDRQYERVGGQHKLDMRARVIAATNDHLAEAVRERRFREDLFFRLKVVPILVPPLRSRQEDIPLLAHYFASHPAVNLMGKSVRFTDEALAAMCAYRWPGNVRELRNLIEYLCFVAPDLIGLSDLPQELRSPQPPETPQPPAVAAGLSNDEAREKAELVSALQQARFRRQEAAKILGIDRTTLWRKMKRHGLD